MICSGSNNRCVPRRVALACAVCALALHAAQAAAVPLTFDTPFDTPTGSSTIGSSPVVQQLTARFTNVATDAGTVVDARVTATVKPETDFATVGDGVTRTLGDTGYLADYTPAPGGPEDDLGFLFDGNGLNRTENGITLLFEFFDGTGANANTFSTPVTVSSLEFAVYDVDGEGDAPGDTSTQSEFFRAFKSDGLTSYALGNTAQALTATEAGDAILFEGPGRNFAEDDASGAAILTFENLQSFTLDFGSVMSAGNTSNPVFTGFDGDLSLIDLADFDDPVSVTSTVPLPPGMPMLLAGLASLGWIARRTRR